MSVPMFGCASHRFNLAIKKVSEKEEHKLDNYNYS